MLSDRIGRARLLMITVAWFAFFTFLSGFTQNFELRVVRGFQGLGFGGEWAAGSVLARIHSAARSSAASAPQQFRSAYSPT